MTQANSLPSTISTSSRLSATTNAIATSLTPTAKPLLLLNDEKRRRRQQALLRKKTEAASSSPHSPHSPAAAAKLRHKSRKKSYIKNHEFVKYEQKSKSQQYASQKLLDPQNKQRMHSKSGPPRYKKKKRTFKLSEPTDSIHKHNNKVKLRKKPSISRVFIHECNKSNTIKVAPINNLNLYRANSYSPSPDIDIEEDLGHISSPPSLSPSLSAPIYNRSPSCSSSISRSTSSSPVRKQHKKQQQSFKLGDDNILPFKFSAATSFSSYQTKYNVHKPRIKPGSNQMLLSAKMKELQAKLKHEEKENLDELKNVEFTRNFGKSLDVLRSIKLPNYSGQIPLILIELKKRLHSVDGLKEKKIFDVSFKNHALIAHKIAHLIRRFFMKLPCKLLDNVCMTDFDEIMHFKQIPDILSKIADPNKSILLWLWDLLSDTIEYQHANKMNAESLSQSIAPNMITSHHLNDRNILISFFIVGIEWRLYLRESQ